MLVCGFLLILLVSCANTTSHGPAPTRAASQTSLPPRSSTTMTEDNPTTVIGEDEQAIYSIFMDDSKRRIIVVREDTLADTLPQSEEEAERLIRASFDDVSNDTLDDYSHANSVSVRLPSTMELGASYVLISAPEFREITTDPGWREVWRQEYPDSEVSCIGFSRVGFNDARTQALIYVTRFWIAGGYYLLEFDEQEGTWKITDSCCNVIIN
jgi:hypothetical protein